MSNAEQYPFISSDATSGEASFRPHLPLTLIYQQNSIEASGLLDTGASVNVIPYLVGIELGYEWERQTTALSLTGNLAQYEARVVIVQAIVGQFEPVQLVFAWTQATNVPLILGQVNFFMEFDVCFYRSQLQFEIKPKSYQS
ncbi:aspartyl protease family protein [Anabaena sp. UHCC 0399]|uniref:aspartyl protease family protein n=1 Tax=Anabaena sp. UHCC 0399 TaxID=3110238 RepID=UPI002B1F816E|nr:aspartyl protease family protein [Anabaena sp. UHCC 0399]MEA5566945.1 aspartyl protease family protein [Anabaena sp. UHCC 0399]